MVTKKNLSLLIWLCRNKISKKTGLIPIYVRITINGDSDEMSTGIKILDTNWDNDKKITKGNEPEGKEVNDRIAQIQADLKRHFIVLDAMYTTVTPEMLKNVYNGLPVVTKHKSKVKDKETEPTLMEAADRHIAFVQEMVERKKLATGTLKTFKTTRIKLYEFLKHEFNTNDIKVCKLNVGFAYKFFEYLTLKDPARIEANSAYKYLSKTKQFIAEAKKRGLVTVHPLQDFQCKYIPSERRYLEMDELMTMYRKSLINRLAEIRDVYIFCCFTGFGYIDVEALTKEHIYKGLDGSRWVSKARGKTNQRESVPLLPIPEEIIVKYQDHPYCKIKGKLLPVNSNQKYNAYLKEIADICGIKINLTTHTARHTFATTITLENDVPLETVSKMLGHKSIKTTQIYAKITQRKVSNNMQLLKNKLFNEDGILKDF
jgi:site-specific recombinase XerD